MKTLISKLLLFSLLILHILSYQIVTAASLVDDDDIHVSPVRSDNPFRSLSQSSGSFQAPEVYSDDYNFGIGALKFNLTGRFDIEFNDNVTSRENNELSDIILKPGISLESDWPISKINTLRFAMGINYVEYLFHNELSSGSNFINITPDTMLRFIVVIDPLTITFSDQFSYLNDPTDAVALSSSGQPETNISRFNRYTNLAGVNIDWRAQNDLLMGLAFSRFDMVPEAERFRFRQRVEYTELAFIKYMMEPTFVIGFNAQTSQNRYRQDTQQDANTLSFGPTVDWTVSRRLSTFLGVSWYNSKFRPNSSTPTASSADAFNGEFTVRHLLTRFYSHSLGYTFATRIGDASNTSRENGIKYGWEWAAFKKITFVGFFFWEAGTDSGGIAPEKYDRFSAQIGFKYILSKASAANFTANHTKKDSTSTNRSFVTNKIVISFVYDF